MLSISEPMKGAGQGNYYLKLAREDYYLAGGEPPGTWHGKGAKNLGLEGQVERDPFMNLLNGFTPDGKTALAANAGQPNRQSGWDLTFSAPKSVSALWSQSSPEVRAKIEAAHERAVHVALDYLESTAGLTRRGKGGSSLEKTPLVFATFEHSTSRALDPQLHTHAVLVNFSQRPDHTTGTLYTKELFRQKMAGGAVYQTELAYQLGHRLGLEIVNKKSGFELAAVPPSLCQAFSKRRQQISDRLQEMGRTDAVSAKIAALDTRTTKQAVSRDHLFAAWAETGREHGWGREQAEKLFEKQPTKTAAKAKPKAPDRAKIIQQIRASNPKATVIKATQVARDEGVSGAKTISLLASHLDLSPLGVRVASKRLFPKAPSWSPARLIKVPYLKMEEPKRKTPILGKVLFEKKTPLGTIQVQNKALFPNAPSWSPARKIMVPHLTVGAQKPDVKRWGKVLREVKTPIGTIQIRKKVLFPKAPKWSPVHGASLPAIKLKTATEKERTHHDSR